MLRSLLIRNFKCFDQLLLEFGGLTLLTGYNGGGKSTAIQPLLFLAQNIREKKENSSLYDLNGPLVRLGTVGDALSSVSERRSVSFTISTQKQSTAWTFDAFAGERILHLQAGTGENDTPIEGSNKHNEITDKLTHLTYISAVRGGAGDHYPIVDPSGISIESAVGFDGRFSAYLYDKYADDDVVSDRRCPGVAASTFRKQVDGWLSFLFPGAQAYVQSYPQLSLFGLQFRLNETGAWRRPANIGYGLSYSFPILVALLAAKKGQLVIIDSPEAHLHPSAQSSMGKLLATFAGAGVQVLVETHSDHLLNGVRLAIRDATLPAEHFKVHFFKGAKKGEHGVVSPQVDSTGRLDEWPSGFFDQTERDLSSLADW